MQKFIFIFIFFILIFEESIKSQPVEIDQFIKETQKTCKDAENISLAWWLPVEFWELMFQANQNIPKEQSDEFLKILKPFVIFIIVDGQMGPFGGLTFSSSDSIKKSIVLIDKDSISYKPLSDDQLNNDIQTLLLVLKPILKNMLGRFGENMNFFVFDDIINSKRLLDPYIKGKCIIKFSNKEYTWKTPIASLLPKKKCPKDNELMSGEWIYCPWHGVKLLEQ